MFKLVDKISPQLDTIQQAIKDELYLHVEQICGVGETKLSSAQLFAAREKINELAKQLVKIQMEKRGISYSDEKAGYKETTSGNQ